MKDIQQKSLFDQANEQINKNKTAVIGLVVLMFAGLASYVGYGEYKIKYEEKAQTAFFEAERLHAANQGAKEFTKSQTAKDAPPVNVDTTQVEQKLNSVIEEYPKSTASAQASILMADILLEKKEDQRAIIALERGYSNFSGNLVHSVLALKLSNVYEKNNQCDKALPVLENVYNSKFAELKPEALLRRALCEETLGQKDKAQQSYQKLSSEFSDTSQGQQAQKYLKIM